MGVTNKHMKRLPYQRQYEAKQVGVLYHSTKLSYLPSILEHGLKPAFTNDPISFTRDRNLPQRSTQFRAKDARLVVDGSKLSQRYSVQPFADKDYGRLTTGRDESEEVVRTPIPDLLRYLIKVEVLSSQWQLYSQDIDWQQSITKPVELALKAAGVPLVLVSKFS